MKTTPIHTISSISAAWNVPKLSKLPVYEFGLNGVVMKAIGEAGKIFILVNIPSAGLGAGQASDFKWMEASARKVAKMALGHRIVVRRTTLLVRTAQVFQVILSTGTDDGRSLWVLSNPEFLAEFTDIPEQENPERLLIGGKCPNAVQALDDS